MAKPRSTCTKVCVFSSHPLVLHQCRRLLAGHKLQLQTEKVDHIVPDAKKIVVPEGDLYVVDTGSSRISSDGMIAAIMLHHPGARVLVLAEEFQEANAFPLLRLGVKGLLRYEEVDAQLTRAVQFVSAGGFWVPRQLLARFVDSVLDTHGRPSSAGTHISGREQQVLEVLLRNLSNKEIANKLNISERTVKFHVSNLLSKFGVQRRADLILLWFQNKSEKPPQPVPSESTIM